MSAPIKILAAILALAGHAAYAQERYESPYAVKYNFDEKDLVGDLDGPRGDSKAQSSIAYNEWYSVGMRRRWGVWGPPAVHYPPPPDSDGKSADWKRERVIATGMRFVGYRYQHHHIPDWDPPEDWPFKEAPPGRQTKGVDCSNFTAFVYNIALGLKPTSDVGKQAEIREVPGPGAGRTSPVQRIEKPATHAGFMRELKTGDLLFIKGRPDGEVSHVVLWIGAIGKSRDDVPLVLDSTGGKQKDERGVRIPDGVYLRPFTAESWYFKSASHALRLIP